MHMTDRHLLLVSLSSYHHHHYFIDDYAQDLTKCSVYACLYIK